MQDGAVGFSTGLIYTPGTYAKTEEIIALAKIAAAYNGVYTTHMRNESDSVDYAIQEALNIAKAANIPLEISHFKVGGQQNWGRSKQTLAMVKHAREEGLDVTIDQYPYTASSTSLNTLLPEWILADGDSIVKKRLQQPGVVIQATDYMLKKLATRKLHHFNYAVVAFYKADTTLNGKSIEQINLLWKRKHTVTEETKTIIDMVKNGGASMVFHGMSEDDVKYIMQYPFNMPASDAGIRRFGEGAPHPRGYGTNARVLGKYVREENIMSLEEAIRRMTSLPAQKFHFKDRGLLHEGFAADIVVFDANTVIDLSTFQKPHQYSNGFKYILVNGKLTLDNGVHTGARNGKALYGSGHHE
jgi:N-acyl-D-amino-acid deacylase